MPTRPENAPLPTLQPAQVPLPRRPHALLRSHWPPRVEASGCTNIDVHTRSAAPPGVARRCLTSRELEGLRDGSSVRFHRKNAIFSNKSLDTVVECTNARPQWAVILAIYPARNMADPKQAALGARAASRSLQARTSEQRAQVLQRMASALEVSSSDITDANARDVSDAKVQGTLVSSLLSEHSERIYLSVTAVVHILVQLRTQGWQHQC